MRARFVSIIHCFIVIFIASFVPYVASNSVRSIVKFHSYVDRTNVLKQVDSFFTAFSTRTNEFSGRDNTCSSWNVIQRPSHPAMTTTDFASVVLPSLNCFTELQNFINDHQNSQFLGSIKYIYMDSQLVRKSPKALDTNTNTNDSSMPSPSDRDQEQTRMDGICGLDLKSNHSPNPFEMSTQTEITQSTTDIDDDPATDSSSHDSSFSSRASKSSKSSSSSSPSTLSSSSSSSFSSEDSIIPNNVDATFLWNKGYRGQNVQIAVLDTGIRLRESESNRATGSTTDSAPDMFSNIESITNWTEEGSLDDIVGHGTFVASAISGQHLECPGVAPAARLHILRTFTSTHSSYTAWFLDALNYAMSLRVDVINLSIGGPDFLDVPFTDKIRELVAMGIVVVSAIGNEGPLYGTLNSPADLPEVIGVGASTIDGVVASFSSRGFTQWENVGRVKPDVITVGKNVLVTGSDGRCAPITGTSIASPIVAGSVALLISAARSWELALRLNKTSNRRPAQSLINPGVIKQILHSSAVRLAKNGILEQGSGEISLPRALVALQNHKPHVSSFPATLDLTKCPYLWPYCSQGIYHSGQGVSLNLTLTNSMFVSSRIDEIPEFTLVDVIRYVNVDAGVGANTTSITSTTLDSTSTSISITEQNSNPQKVITNVRNTKRVMPAMRHSQFVRSPGMDFLEKDTKDPSSSATTKSMEEQHIIRKVQELALYFVPRQNVTFTAKAEQVSLNDFTLLDLPDTTTTDATATATPQASQREAPPISWANVIEAKFGHSDTLWPWTGSLAVTFKASYNVKAPVIVRGYISVPVRSLNDPSLSSSTSLSYNPCSTDFAIDVNATLNKMNVSKGYKKRHLRSLSEPYTSLYCSVVRIPVAIEIIPTPPREKRLIWSQWHQINYPHGYSPRDNLDSRKGALDWNGDSPFSNFRDLYTILRRSGYYIETLYNDLTSLEASLYGALLLIDPEEEYFPEEIVKLQADVTLKGLSLIVVADWYNHLIAKDLSFFDSNSQRVWTPITGGSNLPALNDLLSPFGITFSSQVLSGATNIPANRGQSFYASGSSIAQFPAGGFLYSVPLIPRVTEQWLASLSDDDSKIRSMNSQNVYGRGNSLQKSSVLFQDFVSTSNQTSLSTLMSKHKDEEHNDNDNDPAVSRTLLENIPSGKRSSNNSSPSVSANGAAVKRMFPVLGAFQARLPTHVEVSRSLNIASFSDFFLDFLVEESNSTISTDTLRRFSLGDEKQFEMVPGIRQLFQSLGLLGEPDWEQGRDEVSSDADVLSKAKREKVMMSYKRTGMIMKSFGIRRRRLIARILDLAVELSWSKDVHIYADQHQEDVEQDSYVNSSSSTSNHPLSYNRFAYPPISLLTPIDEQCPSLPTSANYRSNMTNTTNNPDKPKSGSKPSFASLDSLRDIYGLQAQEILYLLYVRHAHFLRTDESALPQLLDAINSLQRFRMQKEQPDSKYPKDTNGAVNNNNSNNNSNKSNNSNHNNNARTSPLSAALDTVFFLYPEEPAKRGGDGRLEIYDELSLKETFLDGASQEDDEDNDEDSTLEDNMERAASATAARASLLDETAAQVWSIFLSSRPSKYSSTWSQPVSNTTASESLPGNPKGNAHSNSPTNPLRKPPLGQIIRTASLKPGRVVVYGDSNCLDMAQRTHSPCHKLFLSMLDYALRGEEGRNHSIFGEQFRLKRPYMSPSATELLPVRVISSNLPSVSKVVSLPPSVVTLLNDTVLLSMRMHFPWKPYLQSAASTEAEELRGKSHVFSLSDEHLARLSTQMFGPPKRPSCVDTSNSDSLRIMHYMTAAGVELEDVSALESVADFALSEVSVLREKLDVAIEALDELNSHHHPNESFSRFAEAVQMSGSVDASDGSERPAIDRKLLSISSSPPRDV